MTYEIPKLTYGAVSQPHPIMCQAEYRTLQETVFPIPAIPYRFRRNPPSPSLVRLGYGVSPPSVIAETYDVH